MIRRLLFVLFLYVLLVWLIAAYLHFGDPKALVDRGLLWTAIGVASLLLWLILDRVIGWWRTRRAKVASKPASVNTASTKKLHEDDAALRALLNEADQRLAQAPRVSNARPSRALDLPLYLIVGPEGSGKTSVFQNCGIEPTLLAGQVLGSGPSALSTRVANLWLAKESLFLEVSGRIFSGDPGRLAEFLSVLLPDSGVTGLKSWMQASSSPLRLRGVVLFVDLKRFMGSADTASLDKLAQQTRERLSAVGTALKSEFPVYTFFTKADGLPYFGEFFSRMGETDAGQVFGTLNPNAGQSPAQDRVWAEAETKRLNREFQSLFLRLSDRRMIALTQEADAGRKPDVYEFPREFKRIRTPLVQFLVDVFRPDPLKPGPRSRGFFFSGTKKVERAAVAQTGMHTALRSTGGEATQFFSPEMMASLAAPKAGAAPVRSGSLVDRWIFVTDFFNRVLVSDRPVVRAFTGQSKLDRYRTIAVAVTAFLLCSLSLIWTVSWFRNRQVASTAETSIREVRRANILNLTNLQALDRLRMQLEQLDENSAWSLHWGLYIGDAVRDAAHKTYFEGLKRVSLNNINQSLAISLRQAGQQNSSEGTGPTYDRLKTHRTITTLGCPVDRALVSRVLKTTALDTPQRLGDVETPLLNTQLDYYVAHLDEDGKVPVVALAEDRAGEENARSYLKKSSGLEQQLQILLNELGQKIKPQTVAEFADNYTSVLSGPSEIPGVFTAKGNAAFQELLANGNSSGSGEACVMGASAALVQKAIDFDSRDQLKSLYYRRYADAWRAFLKSFSVIRYAGTSDAARRLGILSGPRSPLLGIVKLVAVNTNFPPPKPGELSWWEKAAQKTGLSTLVTAESKAADKASQNLQQLLSGDAPQMTAADLGRLFQPVQFTTPAELDQLVNEHNAEYIKGLRGLQMTLDALDHASTAEKAAVIPQARAGLSAARASHAGLADKFSDVGNEGLSKVLADLLEQPIRFAEAVIPANTIGSLSGKKNGELAGFCKVMSPILTKYPFNSSSNLDASLNDIEHGFAPTTGLVWKYMQQSASDLVVKNGQEWVQNPALQEMKVTPELLEFLKRAQQLTGAFYADGGMMQPKLKYVLRPVPRQTIKIVLKLDGIDLDSGTPIQKSFYWPGPPESRGANGTVEAGLKAGFGSYDGLWGVFRLFQNADERPMGNPSVQWSKVRGMGGAGVQPLNPPARVEFVEFPAGVDLFNPKLFEALHCPQRAVVAN